MPQHSLLIRAYEWGSSQPCVGTIFILNQSAAASLDICWFARARPRIRGVLFCSQAAFGRCLNPNCALDRVCFPVTANILEHHHQDLRDKLGVHSDFVLHSLRHTMLTRL